MGEFTVDKLRDEAAEFAILGVGCGHHMSNGQRLLSPSAPRPRGYTAKAWRRDTSPNCGRAAQKTLEGQRQDSVLEVQCHWTHARKGTPTAENICLAACNIKWRNKEWRQYYKANEDRTTGGKNAPIPRSQEQSTPTTSTIWEATRVRSRPKGVESWLLPCHVTPQMISFAEILVLGEHSRPSGLQIDCKPASSEQLRVIIKHYFSKLRTAGGEDRSMLSFLKLPVKYKGTDKKITFYICMPILGAKGIPRHRFLTDIWVNPQRH